MRYPQHLRTAIKHMLSDQGMEGTKAESIELPETVTGEKIDWQRVNEFLGTLSSEDLETFCIGEREEMALIGRRSANGEYAHSALEELFMAIGG